jgi:hypothetical protein
MVTEYVPLAAELEMDLFELLRLATGGGGRAVGHVGKETGFGGGLGLSGSGQTPCYWLTKVQKRRKRAKLIDIFGQSLNAKR